MKRANNIDEYINQIAQQFPGVNPEMIEGVKSAVKGKYRTFIRQKRYVDRMAKRYGQQIEQRQGLLTTLDSMISAELDPEIASQTIILIGPMGTGKSTLATEISKQSGLPRISLDDRRMLHDFYAHESEFASFKDFEAWLTASVLTGLQGPAVIDFGAGHSIYEDGEVFRRIQQLMQKYSNVHLLMPCEDEKESIEILQRHLMERKTKLTSNVIRDNAYFVRSKCNKALARGQVIYTEGIKFTNIAQNIIDQMQRRGQSITLRGE